MKNKKRTNRIMVWVSDDEKNLLETKSKYYGYKTFASYIRDSAVFERVTHIDFIGKEEVCKAYAEYAKEIKKFVKEVKHINQFATHIDNIQTERINRLIFNIIKNQKKMMKLIEKKLNSNVWQEINKNKKELEE